MRRFSGKAEDAFKIASEALDKVRGLASKMLTDWESIVVILAIIAAAVMFSLVLLNLTL